MSSAEIKSTNNDWTELTGSMGDGYWFTLNAQSLPDRKIATVNVLTLEKLLRSTGLPPIHISSEPWKPDGKVTTSGIEVLEASQLSYFEKMQTFRSGEYIKVKPAEPDQRNKSLGWKLNIQTQHIEHDIAINHPRASSLDKTKLFYQSYEDCFRTGIRKIGFLESIGARHSHDLLKLYEQVGWPGMIDALSLMPLVSTAHNINAGNFTTNAIKDMFTTKQLQILEATIGLSQYIGIKVPPQIPGTFVNPPEQKGRSKQDPDIMRLRQELNPNRFSLEKEGAGIRVVTRLLPFGFTFEPYLMSILANLTHHQPIFHVGS